LLRKLRDFLREFLLAAIDNNFASARHGCIGANPVIFMWAQLKVGHGELNF
jgi:hypothetical protein